jgi:hypothetical protein
VYFEGWYFEAIGHQRPDCFACFARSQSLPHRSERTRRRGEAAGQDQAPPG